MSVYDGENDSEDTPYTAPDYGDNQTDYTNPYDDTSGSNSLVNPYSDELDTSSLYRMALGQQPTTAPAPVPITVSRPVINTEPDTTPVLHSDPVPKTPDTLTEPEVDSMAVRHPAATPAPDGVDLQAAQAPAPTPNLAERLFPTGKPAQPVTPEPAKPANLAEMLFPVGQPAPQPTPQAQPTPQPAAKPPTSVPQPVGDTSIEPESPITMPAGMEVPKSQPGGLLLGPTAGIDVAPTTTTPSVPSGGGSFFENLKDK
jgi:hypothetical protein